MNTAPAVAEVGENYWPMPAGASLLSGVPGPILRPEHVRSRSARYRGFVIVARPYRLSWSGMWTVDVEIHHNFQHRSFSEATRYLTEAEAGDRCLELGRLIIDGKLPPWSIEQLLRTGGRFPRARLAARIMLVGVTALLLLASGASRRACTPPLRRAPDVAGHRGAATELTWSVRPVTHIDRGSSPIDTGIGEAAWARNRRVELAIVDGDMPLTAK